MDSIDFGDPIPHSSVVLVGGPRGVAYQRMPADGSFHGTDGTVVSYDELFDLDDRDPLWAYRPVPYATLARTYVENFVLYTILDTRTPVAVFDTSTSVLAFRGQYISVGGQRKADKHYLIENGYDILALTPASGISSTPRFKGSVENPRPLIEALFASCLVR